MRYIHIARYDISSQIISKTLITLSIQEKLKFVTVLGAGLLVGTALTVIIPEGIRSLYMDSNGPQAPAAAAAPMDDVAKLNAAGVNETHKAHDYSRTIGLSLVLGFVFMMLVDQVSQRKSSKGNENEKNITATLGLVVHAAGAIKYFIIDPFPLTFDVFS